MFRFFNRKNKRTHVPLRVHEEALTTIEMQRIEIETLTEQNELLKKQVKQRDQEIDFMKRERSIDQEFIADLLAKILKYTDVPAKEIKSLEKSVRILKNKSIFNYGK